MSVETQKFQSVSSDVWITAPQWISDLKSLLSLPVGESIMMQVIKGEIRNSEFSGYYEKAIELLKIGLVLYPGDAFFPFRTGMILAVFDPEQSQQYLAMAKVKDQTLVTIANQAIQFFESTHGEDILDSVYLGQVMGQVNEWQLAKVLFTRAVEADPLLADAWALLGQAKVMIGEDGFDQFSKALRVNPNSPIALALMSMYWKTHQRIDLALDYMKLLQTIQEDQISWMIELGNLHALNQNLTSAYIEYLKAVEISPEETITWQNLAIFCLNYSMHLEDVLLPAVRKLIELAPNDPLSLSLMGQSLIKKGDIDTAERFLLQSVEKAPALSEVHYFLGYLYINKNLKSAAFPELVTVIRIDGNIRYGPLARRLLEEYFGPK